MMARASGAGRGCAITTSFSPRRLAGTRLIALTDVAIGMSLVSGLASPLAPPTQLRPLPRTLEFADTYRSMVARRALTQPTFGDLRASTMASLRANRGSRSTSIMLCAIVALSQ